LGAPTNVTTLAGGKVVTVTPQVPAAAVSGTPIFLFRRVEYEFKESVSLPGRRALWRKNVGSNVSEELISPFDASARFLFYVNGVAAAQAAAPGAIADLRGLELRLYGESDRASLGKPLPAEASLETAVFFMNRAP
jgi:hypothetical protein